MKNEIDVLWSSLTSQCLNNDDRQAWVWGYSHFRRKYMCQASNQRIRQNEMTEKLNPKHALSLASANIFVTKVDRWLMHVSSAAYSFLLNSDTTIITSMEDAHSESLFYVHTLATKACRTPDLSSTQASQWISKFSWFMLTIWIDNLWLCKWVIILKVIMLKPNCCFSESESTNRKPYG